MTHPELARALAKPGGQIIKDMLVPQAELLHGAVGVSKEAGELLDQINGHVIYGKPLDFENVTEELGDIEFFLEHIRQVLGISRESTIDHNMAKLQKRYPQGQFTQRDAIERKDKL